jgi:hypothetical protein
MMIGRVVSGDSCRFKWSRTASVIIWRLYSYACRRARGLHSYMPHCKLHKLLRYAHFRFYQLHLKVLRSIFPPFNTFVRRKAWLQGSCRPRLRRHSHRRSQVSGSRPVSVCTLPAVCAHSTAVHSAVHHVGALAAVQVESARLRRVTRVS